MRGAEVGPFAEIRFAQDDGAGGAETGGDDGVLRSVPIGEGERTGGGGDGVARFDVVLEQDRDAVERAAQLAALAFLIELRRRWRRRRDSERAPNRAWGRFGQWL